MRVLPDLSLLLPFLQTNAVVFRINNYCSLTKLAFLTKTNNGKITEYSKARSFSTLMYFLVDSISWGGLKLFYFINVQSLPRVVLHLYGTYRM